MRVLAVDPGYDRCGIAVIDKIKDKETLIHSDCFTTTRGAEFSERLYCIGAELSRIIAVHKPEVLAIEKLFFNTNQKTAMGVAEVRGMILYLGAHHKLSIHEYTPLQVKQGVTGDGRGDKRQVASMVKRLLKLTERKRHDDEYDALALGLTCLASLRIDQADTKRR